MSDTSPFVDSHAAGFDPATARDAILARIASAAKGAGRRDVPTLIAVSKTQGWDRIAPVLAAGQRIFGENRVQEAQARWQDQKEACPDLELHLIGPLQTNKVKQAVALFDVIETVDRDSLAQILAETGAGGAQLPRLYIQVNTGEEPQKAGVHPVEADAFIARAQTQYGLTIEGLMCIPPAGEAAGPHFALLAAIARRNGLSKLSMGMSSDFETAVRFGATSVRVGSALFGAR